MGRGVKIGEEEKKFLSRASGIYVQANRYRSLCDSIQRAPPILGGDELYTAGRRRRRHGRVTSLVHDWKRVRL